jgi:hypothetical protein
VSLAIRASSERILSRESARSRAHSRTAVTTESRGDPLKVLSALGHLHLRGRLEQERETMIGTPRRLARFSVAVAGQLAIAVTAPTFDTRRPTSDV